MECNRDEAIRAKEIAERKMENKEFVGARKVLLRAQQLYRDLENVPQMLTVCEVHCSAEQMIFQSERNWYGILQVEQTVDEISLKKQYRKLAFLLHPDKNKFPGAEAAFKLIGEAHTLLTDRNKRSVYDLKFKAYMATAVPKQPPKPPNRKFSPCKQPGVQSTSTNSANPPFPSFRPPPQQHQSRPWCLQTFWTLCPSCKIKYQYYIDVLDKMLCCQNCKQPFLAKIEGFHRGPRGTNDNHSAFSQQEAFPVQADKKVDVQSNSNVGVGSEAQGKEEGGVDMDVNKKAQKAPKLTTEESREGKPSPKTNKGDRKEDCNAGKGTDAENDEAIKGTGRPPVGHINQNFPRRSPRKNQNATLDEDVNNRDRFMSPMKRMRTGPAIVNEKQCTKEKENSQTYKNPWKQFRIHPESSFPNGNGGKKLETDETEAAIVNEKQCTKEKEDSQTYKNPWKQFRIHPESTFPKGNGGEKLETDETEAAIVNEEQCTKEKEDSQTYKNPLKQFRIHPESSFPNGNGGVKLETDETEAASVDNKPKSNPRPGLKPDPEFVEYPDPDFHDFDKERTEDCFAADQIWAIYDTSDSMPRFYARIRKVCSSTFKLKITWLEPVLDKLDEIEWFGEDLPVACGKFKLGNSETTEDRLMFSHLMSWEQGNSKGSYKILPGKGETWALFKNWDICWKLDPDNHRNYEFEFVEVLSDYAEKQEFAVAYLVKVKGFVSLFKQTSKKWVIPANELLRFSHRIPCFRMTGIEREDVPKGSLELDPAAFYVNFVVSSDLDDCKDKFVGIDSEVNDSRSISQAPKMESLVETLRPSGPKMSRNFGKKIAPDSEGWTCGNGFPTESKNHENHATSEKYAGECSIKEEISKRSECLKEGACGGGSSPGDVSISEVHSKNSFVGSLRDVLYPSPASFPEVEELQDTIFYNFDANKSQEKFIAGQVWALYCDEDSFPKYYARITRVEYVPKFKLHLTWLEACRTPKNTLQWLDEEMPVSCGVFKLGTGRSMVAVYDDVTSFSHQVRIESLGRNRYSIYPGKGEIWALYKDLNPKWTCSELAKCDYDIVEVLEDEGSVIKVLGLSQVDGFKTVFKAQSVGGSENTVKISRGELLRFSHQIPAFLLTEESDGCLKGCWELDPASFRVD